MYNEGKDSCYIDGYNQGLLEGHVDGWDEAKGYYQKIFEKERRETEQLWKEEVGNNEYSEVIAEEYKEPEVDGKWSSYSQGRDSKQSESWIGLKICPTMSLGILSNLEAIPLQIMR
jgi:hypothetical protein